MLADNIVISEETEVAHFPTYVSKEINAELCDAHDWENQREWFLA